MGNSKPTNSGKESDASYLKRFKKEIAIFEENGKYLKI